jgi:hypothetical protein
MTLSNLVSVVGLLPLLVDLVRLSSKTAAAARFLRLRERNDHRVRLDP